MTTPEDLDPVHTGPGTLAGRYLRMFWQPVFRAEDLKPGWPRRIHIMGEHFTLYRGDSGHPYLVADRCAHRGTQLSLGWIEGECVRCFYHGWVFDGAGRCVEQPAERESFARKVRIASYPVEEYLGLVFAYLGEGAPRQLPRYPELEDDALGPLQVRAFNAPANYFQRIENDLDETHLQFVHKHIAEQAGMTVPPQMTSRETAYGIYRESVRDQGERRIVRKAHYLMPNSLLVIVSPPTKDEYFSVFFSFRVPIDDENTLSVTVSRMREHPGARGSRSKGPAGPADAPDPRGLAEEIMAGKLRIQDVDPSYPHIFQVQDNVSLMGQGLIADRSSERLGRSDEPLILLRRIWQRELGAMAEGRPIKDWRRTPNKLDLGETPDVRLVSAKGRKWVSR